MNRMIAHHCLVAFLFPPRPGPPLLQALIMGMLVLMGTAAAQDPQTVLPASPIEKAEQEGTTRSLSLRDLTKLALENNLDIAISDTNEEMFRQRVFQVHGEYDPIAIVGVGLRSREQPNTRLDNISRGGNSNNFSTGYWNLGFRQNLPTGGAFQVDWNSGRSSTNQSFALFDPQYNADLTVGFTQPLFRNFKTDQTRANIKLYNLDIDINDSQFKQRVTNTIAQIQSLYWDLVYAIRDYDIKRESVELAQIQLKNNKKKVEIGTLAPIGITEARAEVASREQEMIASEEAIYTVQNNLRNLLSNDRNADIWRQTIVPTESADFREVQVEMNQAIDTALANRPELEQLQLNLAKNDISYQQDLNQKKWQLDLVGSFGSVGVAGPQTLGPGGTPTIDPQFVGGIGNSYQQLFNSGFLNWVVGVNLEIPLKNRRIESALAQRKIERRQTLMNRKITEQQVIVEVRNAVQTLETNKKRVETAKVATSFAREQLDGENKRFQAGLSENFRVLDRQSQLSRAQGVELQTLIAYKKSTIDLQKAMYTLLEFNDFEVAKGSSQNVPDVN